MMNKYIKHSFFSVYHSPLRYYSESKVLEYFANLKHNSAAPEVFIKVTNDTGL